MEFPVLRSDPYSLSEVPEGSLQPAGSVERLGPCMESLRTRGCKGESLTGQTSCLLVLLLLSLASREIEKEMNSQLEEDRLMLAVLTDGNPLGSVGVAHGRVHEATLLVQRVPVLQQLVEQDQPGTKESGKKWPKLVDTGLWAWTADKQ